MSKIIIYIYINRFLDFKMIIDVVKFLLKNAPLLQAPKNTAGITALRRVHQLDDQRMINIWFRMKTKKNMEIWPL